MGTVYNRQLFKRFITPLGLMLITTGLLSGCATTHTGKFVKSENYNSRVSIVVLHYTVSNFEDSLNILTKPSGYPVSSHYLVPTPADDTYPYKTVKVYQLVNETDRAWHAGKSYWNKKTTLNDMSIGIEIVNEAHCECPENSGPSLAGRDIVPDQICTFPDYPEAQISSLVDLLSGIVQRNPDILPTEFVGHSDIAPQRKLDPGPRFPWQHLAELGYGAWFDDAVVLKYEAQLKTNPVSILDVQKALHSYGYGIEQTGVLDEQTRNVIKAFQMHFNPSNVTGQADVQSVARLYALIEKYRPKALKKLIHPQEELAQPQVLASNQSF